MLIIIQQTNLHQMFCEFVVDFKVIFKSIKGPDNTFQEELQVWMCTLQMQVANLANIK